MASSVYRRRTGKDHSPISVANRTLLDQSVCNSFWRAVSVLMAIISGQLHADLFPAGEIKYSSNFLFPPLTVFMVPPGSVDKWQSGTPPLSVSECLQFSLDYLYPRELTTFVLFWADPLV